jgi:hypothetical protein
MMCGVGAPRSRTPQTAAAREIASALYPDLDGVVWIPSDDADVFRLTFTSGRDPRILKMATHGIQAVWWEIGAFPVMRCLGVTEVPEFEHTTDDVPDRGVEFHVTRELADPAAASRALADMWAGERPRALAVARWLGDCARRIESLDWRQVPRANSPARSLEVAAPWWQPQYALLLARSDCPEWAREFIERVCGELSRPPEAFGGWAGELLRGPDGRFVLIDWPGLGAAHRGSQAAVALEVLLRFRAEDPAPLVEEFLAGWAPEGLDAARREDLRLWWTHGILWWPALNLSLGGDPGTDLSDVYRAARHCLATDDPVGWLAPGGR